MSGTHQSSGLPVRYRSQLVRPETRWTTWLPGHIAYPCSRSLSTLASGRPPPGRAILTGRICARGRYQPSTTDAHGIGCAHGLGTDSGSHLPEVLIMGQLCEKLVYNVCVAGVWGVCAGYRISAGAG